VQIFELEQYLVIRAFGQDVAVDILQEQMELLDVK